MFDDLAGYGPGTELDADLCIVGSGAAGIALARRFLGSGRRVLLLESGGLDPDPDTDRLKDGRVDGIGQGMMVEGRGRVFGGTTTLWAGQCIPMDPIDFEHREWVPDSGWPIPASELRPYYEAAAALFEVPGESYDEALWRRWGESPPAVRADRLVHTYTAWSPQPNLGRALRPEFSRSEDVRVLLHATVTGIETDEAGGHVEAVTVRSLSGARATIRTKVCVLCCGGIENARLLLSAAEARGREFGPGHENIGRYFQDHPNTHCATIRTAAPARLQAPYSLFYRRRRRYLPKIKLAPEVQRSERVLNCAANLDYEFEDEGLNALRRVYRGLSQDRRVRASRTDLRAIAGGLPSAAATAYRRLALGRSSLSPPARIRLQIHCEQAPRRDSLVRLSRERDALGQPLAHVQWRLGDLERRTLQTMTDTVTQEFSRLGLADTDPDEWLARADESWLEYVGDSYHHAGTTRMSETPADGVVDTDGQVHGVSGLFVTGSSAFPTSGFANPTLAITALSLRLADHLERRLSARRAA